MLGRELWIVYPLIYANLCRSYSENHPIKFQERDRPKKCYLAPLLPLPKCPKVEEYIYTCTYISSLWFCKDIVQKYIQYHDTARGHSFCPEQGALCYTSRPKHGLFPCEDIESMHGRVVMGTHWTALKWQCYVIFLDFFCLSWIEPYYWKYFRFCGDIRKTKESVCRDFLQNCFCRWIRSLDGFDDAYIKTII